MTARPDSPWDPDGDGDDDSSPDTDTDNSHWNAAGEPIVSAFLAAGMKPPSREAEYDPEVRDAAAKYAMPDGSYPIDNCAQLTAAANLAHHSKTYSFDQVKAHVMTALKGLSCPMSDLPDTWTEQNAATPTGDERERPPRDGLVRALPELRFDDTSTDGSPGTLTGYLAVFNDWSEINSAFEGHFMERVAPTAFNQTISSNRGPDGQTRMKVTFNHGKDPHLGDKVLGIPACSSLTLTAFAMKCRCLTPLTTATWHPD